MERVARHQRNSMAINYIWPVCVKKHGFFYEPFRVHHRWRDINDWL